MDLISVIMPYYNKLEYLQASLESALKQSYKNIEIIIIYDDKDLNDYKIIKKLTNRYRKVKIIINKAQLGAGKSRNKGILNSKGSYIAFLDCDDVWYKKKLEAQIKFMKKNKLEFSHTSYEIIDKNNFSIGCRKAKSSIDFKNLTYSCDIGLSTVMIKKSLIKKFGFKFASLKTKEDYVLWLQIIKKIKYIHGLKKKLAKWRKLEDSLSSNSLQKIKDGYLVYYKFLKFNKIKSAIYLFYLSFNYLLKKIN